MEEVGLGRLLGVLIAPRRAFAALAAHPTWAPPAIALTVAATLDSALLAARTDFLALTREAVAAGGRPAEPEQIELMARWQESLGVPLATVSLVIALLVLGLVFWITIKLVGGEASYRQSLATTAHGLVPWLPAMLLSVPSILARKSIGLADYQRLGFFPSTLPTSLAELAPADASPTLLAVLSSADLISLWSAVLLAIGFSVVAKVSKATAGATVLALWLVYVLGKLGWVLVGAA